MFPQPLIALVDFSLLGLFMGSAALGAVVLLAMSLAGLFGIGGAEDGGDAGFGQGDVEGGSLGGFSLRAMAAFALLFGLVGWGGAEADWPPLVCTLIALLAGVTTMAAVVAIARWQAGLTTSGTAVPSEALGRDAEVYLRIPAKGEGVGKISVELGGRWLQYPAISSGIACPTGSRVHILALESDGVYLVESRAHSQAQPTTEPRSPAGS
jgi:hypothetical protein